MVNATRKREGFEGQRGIVLPRKVEHDFLCRDQICKQVYITDIGYYPKAKGHFVNRPQGSLQHILIYCVEGAGWWSDGVKRFEVKPTQFAVIPAGTAHSYGSTTGKPWTIYWFHYQGKLSGYITELLALHTLVDEPDPARTLKRVALFEEIYSVLEKGYSDDSLRYTNMTFYHFLSSMIYDQKFRTGILIDANGVSQQIIQYMQDHLAEVVDLGQLASLVNLSVSRFASVFKAETGYAPIEYFNHLKIQRACQFLRFTNLPVKRIAYELGMKDPYYFSRLFSKLMNTSPIKYRREIIRSGE